MNHSIKLGVCRRHHQKTQGALGSNVRKKIYGIALQQDSPEIYKIDYFDFTMTLSELDLAEKQSIKISYGTNEGSTQYKQYHTLSYSFFKIK